jgi:hypothetical protein
MSPVSSLERISSGWSCRSLGDDFFMKFLHVGPLMIISSGRSFRYLGDDVLRKVL